MLLKGEKLSLFDPIVDGVKSFFGFDPPQRKVVGVVERAPNPEPKPQQPTTYVRPPTAPLSTTIDDSYLSDLLRQHQSPLPGGNRTTPPPVGNSPDTPAYPTTTTAPRPTRSTVRPTRSTVLPTRSTASVRVFDSSNPTANGSAGYIGDGASLAAGAGPQNAQVASRYAQQGLDYYASTFGRNGIDEAGKGVDIVVNDRSTDGAGGEIFRGNGGYYFTTGADGQVHAAMRFGTGTSYEHQRGGQVAQYEMLYADDLTIHELTHGIINHETGQVGGTADESGAVNEALADVMAASATRDWRIGEKMYATGSDYGALRNIANPTDARAVHELWTRMSQYRAAGDDPEEHYASGIVSNAAYRMQRRIGGDAGWQAVEQLFYHAINSGRLSTLSFGETARALRTSAGQLWGASSSQASIVDQELRAAGL